VRQCAARNDDLEEKAGQLSQYFYFGGWAAQNELVESRCGRPGRQPAVRRRLARDDRLQRIAVEESRLGIPLLFGFDVIHGLRTIAPLSRSAWPPPGSAVYEQSGANARVRGRPPPLGVAIADCS